MRMILILKKALRPWPIKPKWTEYQRHAIREDSVESGPGGGHCEFGDLSRLPTGPVLPAGEGDTLSCGGQ